jgi:O-antigen/teichoic acid export membrane protein
MPYRALVEESPPAVVLVPASADSAALVDPGTAGARHSLARGGSLVGPALTLVNVVGYALALVASRRLDQDRYGQLTALLGALLVASVPGLAWQAVVARSVALRPSDELPGARERSLLRRSVVAGVVVAAVAAGLAPLVGVFLHAAVPGPLWLAGGLLPLSLLSGAMGVLQGEERFGRLALLIGAQAVGKAAGLVPLLYDGGPAAVLAFLALGTAAAALVGVLLVARGPRPRTAGPLTGLPGLKETTSAAVGLVALLALANLDLLLARHLLTGADSGRYSAGAVCAKAAFWLPQAVAVVVFPRLSDPEGGRAVLRRAVLVVAGLGAVELLGAVLLGRVALEVTFGRPYGSLGPLVPVFVLQGAALAVVQLLVYRAIATRDPVPVRVALSALAAEAVAVLGLRLSTPGPVIGVATGLAVAVTLVLLVRAVRA